MAVDSTSPAFVTDRQIRVFISSTFRDMQMEREELIKRVFPLLRKKCEQRGVIWAEVDLRWGITEEQKAEGKVLPICLAEIQNCRPYFIGILGERYGWVPDEIPAELLGRYGWLKQHKEQSVTELEILHGVLNNPDMAGHAFFYFRSPDFLRSVKVEHRAFFEETSLKEELQKYGKAEAERRAEDRKRKLAELKQRIRLSGFPYREKYSDAKELGKFVLKDFEKLIDCLFPEGTRPKPLDRELQEHEMHAAARSKIYVGGKPYFERLDEYVSGDGLPLVLTGPSGIGKSALIAKWVSHYSGNATAQRKSFLQKWKAKLWTGEEKIPVILHFVGASSYSADWVGILRRLIGEFNRQFEINQKIPDDLHQLRKAFADGLNAVAEKGRVILIIDGLNQLEDRDQAPDLVWLPERIPPQIRLIVSTLPGRSLVELKRRAWPIIEVSPLSQEERLELVQKYLAQYSKTLSSALTDRLVHAEQTANPLFLRALLEELRLYGDHDTLNNRIEHYLGSPTIDALYDRILERYETDYDVERPNLVQDAMSLLWAARRGLSQTELLQLLKSPDDPMAHAYWSTFYVATEQSFVNRSGLLSFSHEYVKKAVEKKYLNTEEFRTNIRMRLADYFESTDVEIRKIEELPWQLAAAKSWQRLYALLADLAFLKALWQLNSFEVKRYWTQIEAESSFRMLEAYKRAMARPMEHDESVMFFAFGAKSQRLLPEELREHQEYATILGTLLRDKGHVKEAGGIFAALLGHHIGESNTAGFGSMQNYAATLAEQGKLDEAMELYKRLEPDFRNMYKDFGMAELLGMNLNNQGGVLHAKGDKQGALRLLKEAEQLMREAQKLDQLAGILGSQSMIAIENKDHSSALTLLKEADRLFRETGNPQGRAHSLGGLAMVLMNQGDVATAEDYLKEAEELLRQIGDQNGLAKSMSNHAQILTRRGDLPAALKLVVEAESLFRATLDVKGLSQCLLDKATIHQSSGDLLAALSALREQEQVVEKLGNPHLLLASLHMQIMLMNNPLVPGAGVDDILRLLVKEEGIYRQIGDLHALARTLGGQALTLKTKGNLAEALEKFREKEKICRSIGKIEDVVTALTQQSDVLFSLGDMKGAMTVLEEKDRISRTKQL